MAYHHAYTAANGAYHDANAAFYQEANGAYGYGGGRDYGAPRPRGTQGAPKGGRKGGPKTWINPYRHGMMEVGTMGRLENDEHGSRPPSPSCDNPLRGLEIGGDPVARWGNLPLYPTEGLYVTNLAQGMPTSTSTSIPPS